MITKTQASYVVSQTAQRGLQTIVRKVLSNFFGYESHMTAAAIVVAGAEAMVTTGMKSKADYLAICEAAFDHAMV